MEKSRPYVLVLLEYNGKKAICTCSTSLQIIGQKFYRNIP